MTTTHSISAIEADAAIDRLLVRAEPVSIVDGLFELTDGGTDDVSDGWNRAVYNRLRVRLAERIRLAMARDGG